MTRSGSRWFGKRYPPKALMKVQSLQNPELLKIQILVWVQNIKTFKREWSK